MRQMTASPNRRHRAGLLLAGLLFVLWPLLHVLRPATAQRAPSAGVPHLIGYQGQLRDAANQPLGGPVGALQFDLFETPGGGGVLWSEVHHNVALDADGRFSVLIGSINTSGLAALLAANPSLWLQITVDGNVLSPRQPLASAPYALSADSADWNSLRNMPAEFQDGDQYNVPGIGLESSSIVFLDIRPSYRLPQACGDDEIARWDDAQDLWVCDTLVIPTPIVYDAGPGLQLVNNGTRFRAAFTGVGGSAGTSNFVARSDHHHGGQLWTVQNNNGLTVQTQEDEPGAAGLLGEALLGATIGVEGRAIAGVDGATGVRGDAQGSSGVNYGVYGRTSSPDGYAVYADGRLYADSLEAPTLSVSGTLTVGRVVVADLDITGGVNMPLGAFSQHQVSFVNPPAEADPTRTTADPSVIIGRDGRPAIAFHMVQDSNEHSLMVAWCHDVACRTAELNTVDSAVGPFGVGVNSGQPMLPHIAIGQDGLPVIAYFAIDAATEDVELRLAHCLDRACRAAEIAELITAESTAPLYLSGDTLSMAVGAYGPVIAVQRFEVGNDLLIIECFDPACGEHAQTVVDDGSANPPYTGWQAQVAIGSDNSPLIVYRSQRYIWLAHCADTCVNEGTNTVTIVADLGTSTETTWGDDPMLAIGEDGLPLLSYRLRPHEVVFARCRTLACDGAIDSRTLTIAAIDSNFNGTDRKFPEVLSVPPNGLPIYAAIDSDNSTASTFRATGLQYYTCTDSACSGILEKTLDPTSFGGVQIERVALTIGADGNPLIVSALGDGLSLDVTWCADRFCSQATRRR